jgi:DNA-binding NarL/FixJ family response regulator
MVKYESLRFTDREVAIARLMAEGKKLPEIADDLHIPTKIARIHAARLATKVGNTNRAAIVAYMIRQGHIK